MINSLLMAPAFARDVFIDSGHMDTELSAGFGQDHPLSFKLNPYVIRSISHLLFSGSPSAILRRIRAVIVDSVNAVFRRWTATHIGQEVVERIKPALAESDATDVATGIVALGIKTTGLEVAPSAIFRARIFTDGFAVSGHGCAGDLLPEAAAGFRDSVLKARGGNGSDRAAITSAFPKCRITSSTLQHCPTPNTLSCKILKLHSAYIPRNDLTRTFKSLINFAPGGVGQTWHVVLTH